MWLKRVRGAALEVIEGQETSLGQPFEVDADLGRRLLKDDRFESVSQTQSKRAARKARDAEDHGPTGSGSLPAPDEAQPEEDDA